MTDTFTFVPKTNPTGTGTIAMRTAQFGDGYAQEAPQGINPVTESWPLSFEGYTSEVQPVKDFITAHIGKSFYWTPPLGVQGYYKCKSYSTIPLGGDVVQFNPTLYQSYLP